MDKVSISSADDFRAREGEVLFQSAPQTIDAEQIQAYCRAINQLDWFHFDEARAQAEFGGIVAPGTMTLTMIHPTYFENVQLNGLRALFLGSDRFRIVGPLVAGDALSLTFSVNRVEDRDEGFAVHYDFEWARSDGPVSVGNMIVRYWPLHERD